MAKSSRLQLRIADMDETGMPTTREVEVVAGQSVRVPIQGGHISVLLDRDLNGLVYLEWSGTVPNTAGEDAAP